MLKINHRETFLNDQRIKSKEQLEQELAPHKEELIRINKLKKENYRGEKKDLVRGTEILIEDTHDQKEKKWKTITFLSDLAEFINQQTGQNQPHSELIKKIVGDNWEDELYSTRAFTNFELTKSKYKEKFFDYLTNYCQEKNLPELTKTDYLTQYNELVEKWNRTPQSQQTYWPLIIIVLVTLLGLYLIGKYLIRPSLKKPSKKETKH